MAEEGMTPLMIASMYISDEEQRADVCKALLELRADPLARDAKGNTALHRSAWSPAGNKACRLLLGNKVDVNCENEAGETPLWTASFRNPTTAANPSACMETLLKAGAKVDVYVKMGWAPMHILSVLGSPRDVDLLVEASADVNQRSRATPSFADQAAKVLEAWKEEKVCKMVMDIFCHLAPGSTPLMWSCLLNNVSTGLHMLELKADPSIKSSSGLTALDFARLRKISGALVDRLEDEAILKSCH
mmetsp:Transcript_70463/g.153052  ORF Transcript_70463/g.153052 Transcript_70463/m.153052 type:complete len:246 (-) Transcript_70463:361-1098(-)